MTQILDQYGRPVRRQMLDKQIAAPSLTGLRSLWNFGEVTNGLTPIWLARVLRSAAEGDHEAYLTLAEEMEERDPHYASVLGTRKRAVSGLPVVVEAASDDPGDVKLADMVRLLFKRRGIRALLQDLMDSVGKGYSVVEIMWSRKASPWMPVAYEWRDPRFFQFDQATRREVRLRDESDMLNGLALEPYKFLVHNPRLKSGLPIRGGLARLSAWSWMFKTFGIKDWMAFSEVFGMPLRLGKYPSGETPENVDILRMAVANLGTDASAVIPEGMKIEFQELANTTGGAELFERMARFFDAQISKAVLGQTMTTDDGSSRSQAEVHNEVRKDLRDADADQLEETLERDLVIPFITLNWGPQQNYPSVYLREPESADVKLLTEALNILVPLGLRVETSEVRDKLGFSDPAPDAECLQAPQASVPAPVALPAAKEQAMNREGPTRFSPDQQALEDMIAGVMPDAVQITADIGREIDGLIRKAKSFEDLQALLAAFLDQDGEDPLQDALQRALVAADMHGRDMIGGEDAD
jgi:phage gp29-like protein